MQQDSFGKFLEDSLNIKVAEIQFPASNINIYQEDNNTEGGQDLLEYAEDWGGSQNRPFADQADPNAAEHDPLISRQGERPQEFDNAIPPEEAPVSTSLMQESGNRYPSDDKRPSDSQTDVFGDRNKEMPPIGYPNDYYDEGDDPTDRVYVNASTQPGKKREGEIMSKPSKRLVEKVVKNAYDKGFQMGANQPHRIKVAFLEDLYGFDRDVDSNTLIHKANKELWQMVTAL
jgi:hypothetical protein